MFGYVVINKPELKFKEFDVYKSFYCGLCYSLRSRYGFVGQFTLSYDMTFLVMLLTSLYEPKVAHSEHKCIRHPLKAQPMSSSIYSDYVADMNILLSYYKAMDDWNDDRSVLKLAFAKLLNTKHPDDSFDYAAKADSISSRTLTLWQGFSVALCLSFLFQKTTSGLLLLAALVFFLANLFIFLMPMMIWRRILRRIITILSNLFAMNRGLMVE